jgi:hypothetical protein
LLASQSQFYSDRESWQVACKYGIKIAVFIGQAEDGEKYKGAGSDLVIKNTGNGLRFKQIVLRKEVLNWPSVLPIEEILDSCWKRYSTWVP